MPTSRKVPKNESKRKPNRTAKAAKVLKQASSKKSGRVVTVTVKKSASSALASPVTGKLKALTFRTDEDFHARVKNIANSIYHVNVSEFLQNIVAEKVAQVEEEQQNLLKSRLHLSPAELKIIAAEVDNPSEPTEALKSFMSKDHKPKKNYEDKFKNLINDIDNRRS